MRPRIGSTPPIAANAAVELLDEDVLVGPAGDAEGIDRWSRLFARRKPGDLGLQQRTAAICSEPRLGRA